MNETALLFVALACLLAGLVAGKLWERYRLQEGRWIDRRRSRESPHFVQGLNFLVAGQLDLAIDEFTAASKVSPDALEIPVILGNLYREKGQVGRAVQIHQQLLQRPRLSRREHGYVMLCLGLDFKRGGFVDRALEAFREVLRLDPGNSQALLNLEKLHEDQHQWAEAYAIRQQLAASGGEGQLARHRTILAFLENELGREALKRMEYAEAAQRFTAAIALDPTVVPAYLHLGDVQYLEGQIARAVATWEQIVDVAPDKAYLAFDRLASAYPKAGQEEGFPNLCRRLIAASPQDWRARLALAGHVAATGDRARALDLLFEALTHNPHAIALHHAIWDTLALVDFDRGALRRYMELSRQSVFYRDPHICVRCRYRSNELLWQCPHCHEWNTFVEERIRPARDESPEEVPV